MKRFRLIGVALAWLVVSAACAQTTLQTDEQTLKSHGLPTDAKGLLDFFRKRSMKEGDQARLEILVRRLDSDVFLVREKAARELMARGPVALPLLRPLLASPSLEAKRQAERCTADIEATMQAEPISAAARVLAARNDPKAAEVLFNFLPAIGGDPYLEEELLACVGRLTIPPGKVDALVLGALKDPLPGRRMAAAYLIGRRAGAEHREALRELLADPDPRVRERVADGLFGKRPAETLKEALAGDEKILRDQKIGVTESVLLKFFHDRTLPTEDQKRIRGLVRGLGSDVFVVRVRAAEKLDNEGTKVLAFLKEAEFDDNVERKERARVLLGKIREANNTTVPIAAGHLLARTPQSKEASPAAAIRTLLAYIPFADDDAVEEEILTSLTLLSLREPKVEPDLVQALDDPSPARRAAAAYVLGHVGIKEDVARVQPLLHDLNPLVRLRAAQGMMAAHDKAALPSFVNLIQSAPAAYLPRVEETLYRLADNKGPNETILSGSADVRAKAAKAWLKWLDANKNTIDLTNLNDRESYLGLITIAEYDNQFGQINGQVWEGPRNGQKRWSFGGPGANIIGAMDAHALPNGNVLVAENSANRVTERDTKGNIKWEYRIPNGNPIACQRLPNGNTFIATYNAVMEIKPDKTPVYSYMPGPQFYIFGAHKAKNGDIVGINPNTNSIIVLDSKTGQQKRTVPAQTLNNWCGVEMMPNGNFLVASMSTNSVRELDGRTGQEVWSKPFPGAFRATRLPNGNVLVASMSTKRVAEMDRSGTIRWEVTCQGRPWGVHYR